MTAITQLMEIRKPPRLSDTWRALLIADLKVQWHQRRSLLMTFIFPIGFLISGRDLIPKIGGPAVLAICIAIGLPAMGLMGYSMVIARDRETGVFQRLRTTPTAVSSIMGSRIVVQLGVTALMTLLTCGIAYEFDRISIPAASLPLVLLAALVGGLAFLALGQFVVALIKSAEAVSAVARLLYLLMAVIGGLGETGVMGPTVKQIVAWSPIGTTKALVLAAMSPGTLDSHAAAMFGLTLAYGIVFAALGMRWFRWSAE
jgi:ABC-2 type transport system permease protein